MKKLFIALSYIVLLAACGTKSTETQFEKHGVSFTCPADWEITDENNDFDCFYTTIEKQGTAGNGMVTVTWIFDDIDQEDYINMYIEWLKETEGLTKLVITHIPDASFGKYESIALRYTMNFMSIPYHGEVHTFKTGGKAIIINTQGRVKYTAENAEGFRIIEESFSVAE
ncbi:hypothetical protein LJC45_04300 [Alistipes sp. OttesenSCG-928-B03]|nr:hypothetical protein [Alistipes sp. OttesenSCG-928-B03]